VAQLPVREEEVRGRNIRLAGREPTLRPDLIEIVRALRQAGASGVEIETNARILGYPEKVRALRDAGVTRLVVKLFAHDEATWDAHTRVPGSFKQTLRGIVAIRRVAPRIELIAVLVPRREPGAGLRELVDFARSLGFAHARVELRLAKLDLAALPQLADDVRKLRENPPAGLRLDIATG
jgi:molybdenum cofactor biosynthesis enzyme MoaA